MALLSLFNSFYGLAGFFLLLAASSAVPIPGASVLVSSYASLATSFQGLIFVWLFVAVGAFIGDFLVYLIFRIFSDRARGWLRNLKWYKKNEKRVHVALGKHEFSFIFLSRFLIPGVDQVVNYIAGLEKLNARKFIFGAALGELVYSLIYVVIGRVFEDTWPDLANTVSYALIAITFAIAAIYVIRIIFSFFKKRK